MNHKASNNLLTMRHKLLCVRRYWQTITAVNRSTSLLSCTALPTVSTIATRRFNQQDYHDGKRQRSSNEFTGAQKYGLLCVSCAGLLILSHNRRLNAAEKDNSRRVNLLLKSCRSNDIEAIRKLISDEVGF